MLCFVINKVKAGKIRLKGGSTYYRNKEPVEFWFFSILFLIMSSGLTCLGLLMAFSVFLQIVH